MSTGDPARPATLEAARYQAIADGGLVRFETRTVIEVTGEDRVRYLNGQFTNVISATATEVAFGCLLDAKGKLQGEAFIHPFAGGFLLDAPANLGDQLAERLDRYLVADDVVLKDAGETWLLLHAYTKESNLGEGLPDTWPELPTGALALPCRRLSGPGQTCFGLDIWIPRAAAGLEAWIDQIVQTGLPQVSEAEANALQVLGGRPTWGAGLGPSRLLPEAGITEQAVDYHKGCYVGQEVVSRIRSAGKINWSLRHLIAAQEGSLAESVLPGESAALFEKEGSETGEKSVGYLVAWTHHPRLDRLVALAYVRTRVGNGCDFVLRDLANSDNSDNSDHLLFRPADTATDITEPS